MANIYILDTIMDKPFPHTKEQRDLVNTCGSYLLTNGYDNQYYDVEVFPNMYVIVHASSKDDFSIGNIQRLILPKKYGKTVNHDSKRYLYTKRPASYIMANFENTISKELRPFFANNLGLTQGSVNSKYARGSFTLKDILKAAKFCGCDEITFRNGFTGNAVIYNINVLLANWD